MGEKPAYGPTAKILHWSIVPVLVVQYFLGWLMPKITSDITPGRAFGLHMSFGFVILVLFSARCLWRATHPVAPERTLPAWQRVGSQSVHLLLYALAFATIFTGWILASTHGWTVTIFGILTLPQLFAKGSTLGATIGDLHPTLIWILLAAISVHVAAALIHLLVYRDRVLQRMLAAPNLRSNVIGLRSADNGKVPAPDDRVA